VFYDFHLGAPTGFSDLLWMILYYLSDVVGALIGYLVMVLLLNRFFLQELRAKESDSSLFPKDSAS
jgi:predicted membrane protein